MAACGNEEMSTGLLTCNIASNLDLGEYPDLYTLLNWEEKREEAPQHTEVQSTMKDWIELHGIQRKHFTQLRLFTNPSKQKKHQSPSSPDIKDAPRISADSAWEICYRAFVSRYPQLYHAAKGAYLHARKCLVPCQKKYPAAFSYDFQSTEYPLVAMNFSGLPADILTLSHEFGHATQIVATRRSQPSQACGQMPPIFRECCAFLSELALLNYTSIHFRSAFEWLVASWVCDNKSYTKSDINELLESSANQNSLYNYRWNYPLARLWALQLFDEGNPDALLGLYGNQEASKRDLLESRIEEVDVDNPFRNGLSQYQRALQHA